MLLLTGKPALQLALTLINRRAMVPQENCGQAASFAEMKHSAID